MKAHDVGGILLTDDDGHICGLVAEKDYISSITHGSYAPEDVTASQLLKSPMLTGSESTLALEYVRVTAASLAPAVHCYRQHTRLPLLALLSFHPQRTSYTTGAPVSLHPSAQSSCCG